MEWTVKYAPKSSKDLVGNSPNYNKLMAWLKNFYLIRKSEKKDSMQHMVLLLGPPGIGKTSGINALATELNYEIIEFNASDQRNEGVISRLVGRASKSMTNIGYNGRVVLLDEVDGIQGREDRGGLSALMKIAKDSFHPLICTANDPQSEKIRSLKNSKQVLVLNFKKPSNDDIAALLKRIVVAEEITIPDKLLNVICENSRGDIRGAVNDLENLAQDRKDVPMNAIQALSIRDSDASIELALRQIFGEAKTLKQAHEITSDLDVDYSMFMNYMSENVPQHSGNPTELHDMFENVALSDLFYSRIKMQEWKYLKYYYYYLSAGVRASKKTPYVNKYPKFPSLLIDLSRTKKGRALRATVSQKIGQLTHSSMVKTNSSTLPYIRSFFEQLYYIYDKEELNTDKGKTILEMVSSIHQQINLEEEEFIYLFNDPMYEKPSAATEKKQKKLIKIIEIKTQELKDQSIENRLKVINQKKNISLFGIDVQHIPESINDKKDIIQEEKEIISSNKEDTQPNLKENKRNANKKKTISKEVIQPEKNTSSTTKQDKIAKKSKKTNLLDFTEEKTDSKADQKKKKDSKNIIDFM